MTTSLPSIGSATYTHQVPRKRTAAAVLFTDGHGRILLCEPTYKQVWEPPGGAVDADESPRHAAIREVREELDLRIDLGRLLVLDWVPPIGQRTESLAYIYNGGRLTREQTNAITLPPKELRSWAWCTIPQARERLRPLLARRLEAALNAQETGTTTELENGNTITIDRH